MSPPGIKNLKLNYVLDFLNPLSGITTLCQLKKLQWNMVIQIGHFGTHDYHRIHNGKGFTDHSNWPLGAWNSQLAFAPQLTRIVEISRFEISYFVLSCGKCCKLASQAVSCFKSYYLFYTLQQNFTWITFGIHFISLPCFMCKSIY